MVAVEVRGLMKTYLPFLVVVFLLAGSSCSPANKDGALRLSASSFDEEVLKSQVPVLVDFWAEWCQPCRMMDPVIQDLALEFRGSAKVGKVNIDEHPELAAKYGIESIPRFLVFKDGKVFKAATGVTTKRSLADLLNAALR